MDPRNESCIPKTGSVAKLPFFEEGEDVEYPQLGLKVLLVGDCFRAGAATMFARAGCRRADSVAEADLLCFLGGEDVDPALYGEPALRGTHYNRGRDDAEKAIFKDALHLRKPMFGICRGMQFLHVMNGGKLWQHVDNHAGRNHEIVDIVTGEVVVSSSLHHQMCIENDTTFPLAYAKGHGVNYFSHGRELFSDRHEDLEAAVYPAINAVCVQGHPELLDLPLYTAWCLRKVEEFLEELQMMGHNYIPKGIN